MATTRRPLSADDMHHEVKSRLEQLTPKAEMFRSKLIKTFNLVNVIGIGTTSVQEINYSSEDFSDPQLIPQMLKDAPLGLVKFQVYTHTESRKHFYERRKRRIRNKYSKWPPLDIWANWIVESTWFQNTMLFVILANSVALGIQAELSKVTSPAARPFQTALDIFDYCSLFLFTVEIVLKWLDQFWDFWRSGWNIFDCCVTFFSLLPEIISYSSADRSKTTGLAIVATNLRVFRILRSLKVVTRFRQVRLLVLAITKAFKSMIFITMLLFIFAYIFAIAGVVFFQEYTKSKRTDLMYKDSFSTLPKALCTLFQLFTMDHWYSIREDLVKVTNQWFTTSYIILWILIGSFIFRNIFVGIMVNEFQSIRNELFDEVKAFEDTRLKAAQSDLLEKELARRDSHAFDSEEPLEKEETEKEVTQKTLEAMPTTSAAASAQYEQTAGTLASMCTHQAQDYEQYDSNEVFDKSVSEGTAWEYLVKSNLDLLSINQPATVWPRDTLFKYYQLMEYLQDNLDERAKLCEMFCDVLHQIHDTR